MEGSVDVVDGYRPGDRVPVAVLTSVLDFAPGAHFVRLGGARHLAMVDRPRAVAERLLTFAAR